MTATIRRRSPAQLEDERLRYVYACRDALMTRHGFDEKNATETAIYLVDRMRETAGGDAVYIPCASKAERNARIKRDLRPGNAAEIAARERLSVSAVYKIAGQR